MRAIACGGDVSSRVLRGAVAACAFFALVAAALNRIELGASLIKAAFAASAVLLIVTAYRALPSELQKQLGSARAMRKRARWSFVVAVVISGAYWFEWTSPSAPELPRSILELWPTLDFVPSLFSLLLPSGWRSGLHLYFRGITYCFPGPYWWESMRYLRTAIAAYTIVFFAGASLVRLISAHARNLRR